MLTLLIVDDHFVVRSGLVASLELEDDLRVVAEVERGEDVIAAYAKHRPDLVLMDVQLPGISGIEATSALLTSHPEAHVLIFSTSVKDEEIHQAMQAGALGYHPKSSSRDSLLAAIRSVSAGKISLPPEIAQRLRERLTEPEITPREKEILTLVSKGRANKEIAAQLGIAEDTVKQHVSRILQKLRVSDRAQATAEAIRRGIVKL
jgi:DNA-binding NarL/FixJ family response regulator